MPDLSSITLPDNNTYNFKDSVARVSIPFGKVDSTSTSTVFTATVTGITSLYDGVCIFLMNGVVTSAANWTLNINGLGAKPVYSTLSAATRTTTIFNVNYTMLFVYNSLRVNGGCWDIYYGYDSNTNTLAYQIRSQSLSLPMDSVVYRYRLMFMSPDNTKFVPSNNSTSTNATTARTVNQAKINPFGMIVYYGTTTSVAAGSRPSTSYLWTQYSITLGYSFNVSGGDLTLDSWKPVYLKCAPQSDGSAIIDSATPVVQSLPSSEDGKIYIFLGIAYSATAMELLETHPVYYFKDGIVRPWTNQAASSTIEPATANPVMDGTAAVGSSVKYAREDHVHPSDTTKVDKEALDDAGITGITYTTLLDTTTVTTATGAVHPKPYAFLTSSPSKISEGLTYRITVDGVEYTLQARGWFVRWGSLGVVSSYMITIAGNITYFQTDPMFYDEVDDVPFLITTLIQPSSTSEESNGLYIFTQTEKSVSVKIELATFQGETLPNYLIRGETAKAIDKLYSTHHAYRRYNVGYNEGGSNSSFAIGIANKVNNFSYIIGAGNITSDNNTAIVGTNNEVSGSWGHAFGSGNTVSGQSATAIGYRNQSTGSGSLAIGYSNQSTGTCSTAIGYLTTASGNRSFAGGGQTQAVGNYSTALGRYGIANGYYSSVNGYNTLSTHKAQFVFGEYNVADASLGASDARGNYVEIVGNGTADDARSNARTLDWNGNEVLAGKLTVGANPTNSMDVVTKSYFDANGLPSVTSSDNGKILQVVNGAWAAVQLQSASGVNF